MFKYYYLFQALQDSSQLQVAFMCNKPAVYRSNDKWIEDRSTDCIENPNEILEFCRKVCKLFYNYTLLVSTVFLEFHKLFGCVLALCFVQ